jgi:hypothetical protein
MNENHVIDSWIAELGLSSRRVRRTVRPALGQAGPRREAARPSGGEPLAPRSRPDFALAPRYQVISSPC